jgi:hypothetical protein
MRFFHSILAGFLIAQITACVVPRHHVREEVVLRNGNTQTGKILHCDSLALTIKGADKSTSVLPWAEIDSVRGLRLRTWWVGANVGFSHTPYFSVFRNEGMAANGLVAQAKVGWARHGRNLQYVHFSVFPNPTERLSKFGYGVQRYLWQGYLQQNGIFFGSEFNLLNAKLNNGSQISIEPFAGYDRQIKEQWRLQIKMGIQVNPLNRNNGTGFCTSVGFNYQLRNLHKRYRQLNQQHIWEGQ